MISYSGIKYDISGGVPTLHDLCVALMRLPRWCGGTRYFWPVGMHSHVVADMAAQLGPRSEGSILELAGLCHDLAEGCGMGDIASPVKCEGNRYFEEIMLRRICDDLLGLPTLYPYIASNAIHEYDLLARKVERDTMFSDWRIGVSIPDHLQNAVEITWNAIKNYGQPCLGDYMKSDGEAVWGLHHRILGLCQEVVSGVQPVRKTASGPVSRGTVASQAEQRGPDSVPCDPRGAARSANRPSAAGDHAGGVDPGAAGEADSAVFALWCAGCGQTYGSGDRHQCHPDAVSTV